MRSGARLIGIALATAAAISGCTPGAHEARAHSADVGGQDRLVFDGGDTASSAQHGVASFYIHNVDAGPVIVSASAATQVRLECPDTVRVRVRVGDGSRELTVRQVAGQILLRTPIREGGRWYVLARAFGGLISRDEPAAVRPASRGCPR